MHLARHDAYSVLTRALVHTAPCIDIVHSMVLSCRSSANSRIAATSHRHCCTCPAYSSMSSAGWPKTRRTRVRVASSRLYGRGGALLERPYSR